MILAAVLVCQQTAAANAAERAVVELFTSQGCSSCPPADAIAGRLRDNPAVIVLSFHVNYWDDLGWADPFSSKASTDRQYLYARSLGEPMVFTPQLVVNGSQSLVGSQEAALRRAVDAAGRVALPAQVDLSSRPDGSLLLSLRGQAMGADLWEIGYVSYAATRVRGGENGGRTLETYNNVTHIRRLGAFSAGSYRLPALQSPENGLAVVVQTPGMGRVLGAGVYETR